MSDVIATVLKGRAVELAAAITAAENDIATTVSQVADAAVRIAGKKAEIGEARTQLKAIELEIERRKSVVFRDSGFRLVSEATSNFAAEPPPARADD